MCDSRVGSMAYKGVKSGLGAGSQVDKLVFGWSVVCQEAVDTRDSILNLSRNRSYGVFPSRAPCGLA